jgi:acetyl-CoA C-acetyltransferase
MMKKRVYILAALRTAVGKFGGAFKDVSAPKLAAAVIRALLAQTGIAPAEVDEVVLGEVITAGVGMNPARQAAAYAGLPYEVPALTVNRVCGSGLEAIVLGARAIREGEADLVVAGGMENMSAAPYALPQLRWGNKMNHIQAIDLLLHDGLWDAFYGYPMGVTAENLARQYGISREEQDRYAYRSHMRAVDAIHSGKTREEVVPVEVPLPKGGTALWTQDEHPRPDTSLEKLAQLAPAFLPNGTVTAGNASGINDAAAAVILASEEKAKVLGIPPLLEFVDSTVVGLDPAIMGLGPVFAIRKLLAKQSLRVEEIDLWEINEAFAAQILAVLRELPLPEERLNVNGGAIAFGHPIGATGAKLVVGLAHELSRRGGETGVVSLCIGGGMGMAALFRRP